MCLKKDETGMFASWMPFMKPINEGNNTYKYKL